MIHPSVLLEDEIVRAIKQHERDIALLRRELNKRMGELINLDKGCKLIRVDQYNRAVVHARSTHK